ncbi:hypothetical protein GQ55_9G556300 [Panicum hallii var. hallii]|uniref:Uncharacterized protein n=1 Tax=Panicum hallii var. hallii TaxID=1504633 RepID=A0A2T7CFL3_9POAL|nr:hypothetical protein GQ55_9G556300 [Panicum hallii var. hallii]
MAAVELRRALGAADAGLGMLHKLRAARMSSTTSSSKPRRESQALAPAPRRCRGGAGEAAARGSVSGERWIGPWFYAPRAMLIAHGDGFLAETPCAIALPVIGGASSVEGGHQSARRHAWAEGSWKSEHCMAN